MSAEAPRTVPAGADHAPSRLDGPYSWAVALASLLMVTVGMGALLIPGVALKPMAEELGGGRAPAALCQSLAFAGMGVGGVFFGRLFDRTGAWLPVALAAVAIPAGALLAWSSSGLAELYVAHGVFIGLLGNAALTAPLIANVGRWFGKGRGVAVAVVTAGQSLAGVVWAPVFAPLVAEHGWRHAYLLFAAASFVLLAPLSLVLRRGAPAAPVGAPATREPEAGRAPGAARMPPGVVLGVLCAASAGCFTAAAVPVQHLVAYATDLGATPAEAARALAAMLGCAVVGRLAAGRGADLLSLWAGRDVGGTQMLLASAAAVAAALWLFIATASPSRLEILLLAALFGLVYGGILPCFGLAVGELLPAERRGWYTGVVLLFGTLAMAFGGWVGAAVFDAAGSYRPAFLVGGCAAVLGVTLLSLLDRHRKEVGA